MSLLLSKRKGWLFLEIQGFNLTWEIWTLGPWGLFEGDRLSLEVFCAFQSNAEQTGAASVERIQAGHLAGSVTAGVTVFSPALCPCFIQIIPGRLSEPRTGQPIPLLPSALRRGPPGRPHLQHRQIPQQAVLLPSRHPFLPPGRRRHHRRGDPVRRQNRAPGDPAWFARHHRRCYLHFPAAPARKET